MLRPVSTPPAYTSDPKYKKYTQQVEKCLSTFDNVHEWADFISFLKQLLKTFEAYQQFKEIPRKLVVAKRLSQCLNPALPTGVHQRALDVYSHIFAVLGTEGLQRDLALWSSGLFPFFEYAATSVKPTLLSLFDTYYLPLQGGLRPVMKAFILALLPGLEEETGEYFDQVLSLLDRISGTVSQLFFFQNIWLTMLTTPSARGTSLNFLSRRLPTLKADEDITVIVGRDIGLMIRAFSAALEDDDLLVRRGTLDLLVQSLRIDCVAIKQAQPEDRTILMRAASSVVLKRDLSLNRRLYSWLLGPDENSQRQIEYLRENALELLSSTLRDEMFNPSVDYSPSRPFKIFISLLDKWEIGAPMTECLIFDAFKAIKKALKSGADNADDVAMTASTLYEAVEPMLLWKQLFASVYAELTFNRGHLEGCKMVAYLLTMFHTHDEEIEAAHLPVMFTAIAEILKIRLQDSTTPISYSAAVGVLSLQKEILARIPQTAGLDAQLNVSDALLSSSAGSGPSSLACAFYGIEDTLPERIRAAPVVPFVTAFEDLIAISIESSESIQKGHNAGLARDMLLQSLALLNDLVDKLPKMQTTSFALTWKPSQWISALLKCIEQKAATFSMVESVVVTASHLHDLTILEPRLTIANRSILSILINSLLKYVRLSWAAYHMRAVALIWSLDRISRNRHVEAVISQKMASRDPQEVEEACEMFGILWKLTDDELAPGFRLKIPMMMVLDTLKSNDPTLRRVGETWMRCSLKSYLRVLDPILFDLADPSIRRSSSTMELNGKQLEGYMYDRPYDQRYANHLFEALLSVVKFGGQGFSKIARTTTISRAADKQLLQRLRNASAALVDATYMDVILDLLLRFLQSEPKDALAMTMGHLNNTCQSIAIDLLQALIARGEVDIAALQTVESVVVKKLYFCVHTGRLDLQNKSLHLLHSVIAASNPGMENQANKGKAVQLNRNSDNTLDGTTESYALNPLLVQTLLDGISIPSNRPVLQHWLDFSLMTIPLFHDAMQPAIIPLTDALCRQLRLALSDIRQAAANDQTGGDIESLPTDADFIMLLAGIERLVLLTLSQIIETTQADDDASTLEKPSQDTGGLLGYVSTVFSTDTSGGTEEQVTVRSSDYRCLDETVRVLCAIWDVLGESHRPQGMLSVYSKTRSRCRKVLEHLFRAHSTEVMECLVDCWQRESPRGSTAFEIVDILASSAQNVVHMLCENISSRVPGLPEKAKRPPVAPGLTDLALFDFLDRYFQRLEGPLALQVWSRFMQMVKELVASLREFKVQAFSALRCFTTLADKISQTTALEDRRVRKEMQDTYSKLLDLCVTAGRPYDQGSWIRRPQRDNLSVNGRDSPIPHPKLDEKMNASSTSLPDSIKPAYSADLIDQINVYVASQVIPNLRKFLTENDKILTACNSIVYNIVNPSLKGKTRPLDIDDSVLSILQEMTRIGAALKAWRGPVNDVLNDNRCFNSTPVAGGRWRTMVKSLFDTDKTALPELLGKITTAPSANIFTNREYEMLLRSLNLRRLAFVLLSGEKNHFLAQLPSIQEKLVDTLRNVSSPVVQSEVYLCVRVLLCRLSPHNLSSFWPVILTELYRLFEQAILNVPSDGSEELGLILAACKLLDLLLVLQTEEFQIHQWIFITDTVDAVYRPDDWFPDSMLDRLAEVIGNLPLGEVRASANNGGQEMNPVSTPLGNNRPMRRPMLRSLRQIDSIRELIPFFSGASIASYESVYSSGGIIDWEAVEQGLLEDMFDGR
ncbi:hypothetical protein WOLCODRAFT_61246 [Wolfiporia cocos MD-104 SS10]|uniref:Uncharacterized protein n=1 Tax=Wolfiporia cocos (strain MD-104) TaxID=742152 RepID=A0A2H3IWG9_WOLCO|nr:hypothetical protein WOLCODRAFT_61246 [Wolfiporia cocos MD-104 SS10]